MNITRRGAAGARRATGARAVALAAAVAFGCATALPASAADSSDIEIQGSVADGATAPAAGLAQRSAAAPSVAAAAATPDVYRLAGPDRYTTAVQVSQNFDPGVDVVYIATGTGFADALSAAPAAGSQGGPLLLVTPTSLPTAVKSEIQRLKPKKIVVAGGTGAVSASVYNALKPLAPSIRRDAGANRYATSQIVTRNAFTGPVDLAFVATGENFPDALSAGSVAGASGSPVVLVPGSGKSVDAATQKLFADLGVDTVVIAGGTGAVSAAVENGLAAMPFVTDVYRVSGADRYKTSIALNEDSYAYSNTILLATGSGFADALAGAALAGAYQVPLYVIPSNCVPAEVFTEAAKLGVDQYFLLGGTGALSGNVEKLKRCA